MKTCLKCCAKKDEADFYKKGVGRSPYCKPCYNRYCMERWATRKEEAIKYKGGECIRCGYSGCRDALEFHHKDPTEKDYDWGRLRMLPWKKLLLELDKCDLLCANCHREEHFKLREKQHSVT